MSSLDEFKNRLGEEQYERCRGKFQRNQPEKIFDIFHYEDEIRSRLFNELDKDNWWGTLQTDVFAHQNIKGSVYNPQQYHLCYEDEEEDDTVIIQRLVEHGVSIKR